MINAKKLGDILAEEVVNEPGPCFYPGGFKPPHKGDFEAVKNLSQRNYIVEVIILISNKPQQGITPEDSMQIWMMFLKASPNPKAKVKIAVGESPIEDIYAYTKGHPNLKAIYIAGDQNEGDDVGYLEDLRNDFPGEVKSIAVAEKAQGISEESAREALAMGDKEAFYETLPEVVFNKGYGPDIYNLLAASITEPQPTEEPQNDQKP